MNGPRFCRRICAVLYLAVLTGDLPAAEVVPVRPLVEKILAVGARGEGHREAVAAWPELARAGADQLPEILAGMDGAGELATNWLRGVVETIVQREQDRGGAIPMEALEQFLADTRHSPRARRLAYELIARVDPEAETRLIPPLLNDPSLELRRDALALLLLEAESLAKSGKRSEAVSAFQKALASARDLDQVKQAAGRLQEFGVEVNLPEHFGFLMRWKLIGPFDNTGEIGFDRAYPPELEINLSGIYEGKTGPVEWFEHATQDPYGLVDLNAAFGRPKSPGGSGYADSAESLRQHKGVVAYAFNEFIAEQQRDVELRLGCISGSRVWLNGEQIMSNQIYHAGMAVDQYAGYGRLKKGRNAILVKITQNEQSESWAQNWQFQLRVCDALGTSVLSSDRPR